MFDIDFSPYIASFIAIAGIHIMAVISPGPDVALTIRNSLLHSRKVGMAGALGTTAGILVHLTYTVFGIGYIVAEMPVLMNIIRLAGAAYLIYLGYMSFKSTDQNNPDLTSLEERLHNDDAKEVVQSPTTLTPWKAFRIGIINNLLNPLVILLFIGILSSYITSETPPVIQFLYGAMMVMITFLWFSFVVLFFSIDKIRAQFLKLGKWLERLTGGVLIAFGVKVAFLAARAL